MTWDQWLVLLTTASTIYLGYLQYRNSRHATDQASEITLRGQDLEDLRDVRARVAELETKYQNLWLWARRHIDLYYRYRRPDGPDPEPLPDEPIAARGEK